MRKDALELPRDTGHQLVFYQPNADSLHKLNTWLTENVIALSQPVFFKAKAVDEEGVWCACTVEEETND